MKHSLFKAIAALLCAVLSVSCVEGTADPVQVEDPADSGQVEGSVNSGLFNEPAPEKDTFVEAVDLGLSVKWASCNIGATKPEEYGGYYAWGETKTKSFYHWATYKWSYPDSYILKYNTSDNKTVLEAEDDVAHVKLGGSWRMPTIDEWNELIEYCVWTYDSESKGYKVVGKNSDAFIFLPLAGVLTEYCGENHIGFLGHYWSSSVCFDYWSYDIATFACSLYLDNYGEVSSSHSPRYAGCSIRAVTE